MDSKLSEALSESDLKIAVGPSRYNINLNTACLSSWQIGLADNSWHDIFNASIFNGMCLSFDFNVRALPIVGIPSTFLNNIKFVRYHNVSSDIVFGPNNIDKYNVFIPKVTYKFSDLSFKFEIFLDNLSKFPIYWCPIVKFALHLPWHVNLSLDQYSLNSRAKKKLLLGSDYNILESSKCPDKVHLGTLEDNILAVSHLQDQKISITTKNEEETISATCHGKFPNIYFGLRNTTIENCSELLCLADLPDSGKDQNDWSHYKCIQSEKSDSLAIEISAF